MARAEYTKSGDIELTLDRAAAKTPVIAERMLQAGAAIVADEVRRRMAAIFPDARFRLPGALGVTPVGSRGDSYNIKIGFGGYQDMYTLPDGRTRTLKKPAAFQLIARVMENGRKPGAKMGAITARPFFAPAVSSKKTDVAAAMEAAAEKAMNEITQE